MLFGHIALSMNAGFNGGTKLDNLKIFALQEHDLQNQWLGKKAKIIFRKYILSPLIQGLEECE